MKIRILPATVGTTPGQGLSCYIVDDVLAIDAGALGFCGTVAEQTRIEHILLTHSHIDHLAGLPMFLDNIYGVSARCPTVYGIQATLDSLQSDLFNGRLMPDFIGMSARMRPFLSLKEISPDNRFTLGKYTIDVIAVEHNVPTVGYVVDDSRATFALFTDTLPIPEVLKSLAAHPRLKAVFLECSFPRRLHRLAAESCHITTDQFDEIVRLMPSNLTVYPIHMKPQYHAEIVAELVTLDLPNVRIVEPGGTVEI